MAEKITEIRLQNGTLVRHKVTGYQGRIDGTTEIKTCFTRGGASLPISVGKEMYQYRVAVIGESMRHIAPAEDLDILEERTEVVCFRCHSPFRTKPEVLDKAGGHCQCGGWICPACLACQPENAEPSKSVHSPCLKQRKRLVRKLAHDKKSKAI
ncbi:MAG TPA: hypothetical protein VMO00_04495 [Methylomirabilota bacterium]|nr:hypothetical protein [Methylomirabilota bacterium]